MKYVLLTLAVVVAVAAPAMAEPFPNLYSCTLGSALCR